MGQETPNRARPPRPHIVPPPPPPLGWRREFTALRPLGVRMLFVLWPALRRVRVWADTPAERREGLFGPPLDERLREASRACARFPELLEPLGTFTSLLRAPHRMDPEWLADACQQVSEWADVQGGLPAAVLFAEAAATLLPESPGRANVAAYLCRRAAYSERAAMWYLRAFKLATRGSDRSRKWRQREAIRALIGHGTVLKERGQLDEARRYYERASRRARSAGFRRKEAEAHHDLLLMCTEAGALGAAEWHARLALRCYPRSHPCIPALAHDFAFLLIRQRYFTPALTLLEGAIPLVEHPAEQTVVWSTLAWAAAGAGRQDRYGEAERAVLDLVELYDEYAPAALDHLAEGAWAIGNWEQARRYAELAQEAAVQQSSVVVERDVRTLLEKIVRKEPPPQESGVPDQARLELLIRQFLARLQRWRALNRGKFRAGDDANGGEAA